MYLWCDDVMGKIICSIVSVWSMLYYDVERSKYVLFAVSMLLFFTFLCGCGLVVGWMWRGISRIGHSDPRVPRTVLRFALRISLNFFLLGNKADIVHNTRYNTNILHNTAIVDSSPFAVALASCHFPLTHAAQRLRRSTY